MKTKNKGKVQFVQEFRKITAVQKLPTLKQGFGDLFFQNKAQNSKFLRLKDQPDLTQIQLNYRTLDLCQNQFVSSYIYDNQQPAKKRIYLCIQYLNQQIESYKQWAKQLTQFVQKGNYSYVFKSQRASPPVALAKQMQNFDPLAMQINSQQSNKNIKTHKNKLQPQQSMNIQHKLKRFDFNQITDYLITDDYKLQDLDGNVDLVKKQIQLFRQFKNIHQIKLIQQLKVDYQKFQYHLTDLPQYIQKKAKNNDSQQINSFTHKNNSSFAHDSDHNISVKKVNQFELPPLLQPSKTLQQKFKYLSLHKNQLDMNINFFRSLGPPSRNIQDFINNIILNQSTDNILQIQEQNPFTREKVDTCLLHFLQPNELKIDKNSITFYDIENISMSRITSTNAHMCIRSEKVTRLQYEKLLKKMQKLYKLQHEDGKTRIHQATSMDELDENTSNNKGMKSESTHNRLSLQKLVQQINAIRKQAYALQNSQKQQNVQYRFISKALVKDQMSKKMFSLLQDLYKRVCQQLPFNYSILQIGLHVDQVNGLAQNYFETKKLIWFIMTILQQIQRGKSIDKNISYLLNKNKKDQQPKVIKYKGQKVVAKDKMGTKNLYQNNPNAVSTIRQKSISLKTYNAQKSPFKSPLKPTTYQQTQNKNNISTTPNRKTNTKSPYKSTTNKKTIKY